MKTDLPFIDNTFRRVAEMTMGTPTPDPPLVVKPDTIPVTDDIQQDRINRHRDFFALYVVQRGQGTHVIEGIPYAIARGDVYVMGLGTTHYYTQCRNLLVQNMFFSPTLFDAAARDALATVPGISSLIPGLFGEAGDRGRAGRWLHLPPDACLRIEGQITELHEEWEARGPGRAMLLRGLFTRLLIHLARFQEAAHPRQAHVKATAHGSVVTEAMRFLEERYAEPLRIAEVAAAVCLSPDQLTRVFSEAAGQTPRDYLRYLRVERAKALLAGTNLGMADIAGQSGFGESAYFTRAFRVATGMTPREFRRRRRAA